MELDATMIMASAYEASLTAVSDKGKLSTFGKSYMTPTADMIKAAIKSVADEFKRILDAQNVVIESLRAQLKDLQPAARAPAAPTMANILKGKSPEETKQRNLLLNVVSREEKDRSERESNIIIAGLPESTGGQDGDKAAVQKLFEKLGLTANPKRVYRLRQTKKTGNPALLQVSLDSIRDRNDALRLGHHHGHGEYSGVFIREDRTEAQHQEFSVQHAKKKERNAELEKAKLLDNPFRYIITRRSGTLTVRCIDVVESKKLEKHVFKSPPRRDANTATDTQVRASEDALDN